MNNLLGLISAVIEIGAGTIALVTSMKQPNKAKQLRCCSLRLACCSQWWLSVLSPQCCSSSCAAHFALLLRRPQLKATNLWCNYVASW